jgi:predicted ATPase
MGKSTVIQSLLVLRQSYKDKAIKSLKLVLEEGELCKIGIQEQAITRRVEENIISFGFKINNDKIYDFRFEASKENNKSSEIPNINPKPYNDLDKISVFNKHFQYIGAERVSPSHEHSYNKNIVEKDNQISKVHGKCEYAVHFLGIKQQSKLTIKELKHPKESDDSLSSQVEAWLREISPSIKIKTEIDDKVQKVTLAYSYEIGDETMEDILPENTGFGISYALPIVIALLSAQKDDLIIIENPEAHLHPKGQSKLAELMCLAAQAGVQIFCETHSDHIVNGTLVNVYEHYKDKRDNKETLRGVSHDNVKISFFRRLENQSSSELVNIPVSEKGRINKAPKDFFDQMDLDLRKMI